MFLFFAIAFPPAFAAPVLPFALTFDNQIKPALVQVIHPHLGTALVMVSRYPPRTLKHPVFRQESDSGKAITLNFVGQPVYGFDELQALTSNHGLPWINEIRINLLMDRIFFDPSGSLRPDGYVHLTVALAAHLYGPAQSLWRRNPDLQVWADIQKESHRAAVNFIRRVLRRRGQALPPEVTQSLRMILTRERKLMRTWKPREPHCEDIFNRQAI